MPNTEPEDMPVDPFDEDEVQDIITPEPDPGTIAFLDQEEATFQAEREMFARMYGFDHDCRCSQDYTEGNLETVTKCFLTLTAQAMARSAQATAEIQYLHALLERMIGMNNDLVEMMEEQGHEKELEEYFNRPYDEEDQEVVDLEAVEDVEEQADDDEGDED